VVVSEMAPSLEGHAMAQVCRVLQSVAVVCCRVLQWCVAACCSGVLQRVAVRKGAKSLRVTLLRSAGAPCVAVCCSGVLQRVAVVCCSVLQCCVAVCCSCVLQCVAVLYSAVASVCHVWISRLLQIIGLFCKRDL